MVFASVSIDFATCSRQTFGPSGICWGAEHPKSAPFRPRGSNPTHAYPSKRPRCHARKLGSGLAKTKQQFRYRRFAGRLHCRCRGGDPTATQSKGNLRLGRRISLRAEPPSSTPLVRVGGRGPSGRRAVGVTFRRWKRRRKSPGTGTPALVFGPAVVRQRRNLRVQLPTDGEGPERVEIR